MARLSNPKGRNLYKWLCHLLAHGSSNTPDVIDFNSYLRIDANLLGTINIDDLSSDHSAVVMYFNLPALLTAQKRRILNKAFDMIFF